MKKIEKKLIEQTKSVDRVLYLEEKPHSTQMEEHLIKMFEKRFGRPPTSSELSQIQFELKQRRERRNQDEGA